MNCNSLVQHDRNYPYAVRCQMLDVLGSLMRKVISLDRMETKLSMQENMQFIIEDKTNQAFIVHFFDLKESVKVTLSKVTKVCPDKPILIVARTSEGINARACVPEKLTTADFNAKIWLSRVANHFGGRAAPPRGQSEATVCNMAIVKTTHSDDQLAGLGGVLAAAENFAASHVRANTPS